MILDKEAKKGFLSYDAISDRILTVHFNTKPVKTKVIQMYAPSTNHSDDEIEDFYNQLQSVKDSIHNKNQVIKKAARKSNNSDEYDRLKREIKKQLKEDKANWLENKCEQIDEFDRKNKSKDMFDKIRKVQRNEFQVKHITVNNGAGQPIVDPDLIVRGKALQDKFTF